jgi:hypothetical protein
MSVVHFHLLLNHVPVIGLFFVIALLGVAFWRRSSQLGRVALTLLVGISLVTVVVFLTGEPAEEAVEGLAGVSEAAIHSHEDAASVALIAMGVAGLLALPLLWWHRRRELSRRLLGASLVGLLAVAGVMAWTANLGGQIRHTEIRSGTIAADGDDDHR